METVKVKDEPQLVRDLNSGAVLNKDNKALLAYKARKKLMTDLNEINNLKDRVTSMEDSINNIESMLKTLIGKQK